jgi:hypothetical protein
MLLLNCSIQHAEGIISFELRKPLLQLQFHRFRYLFHGQHLEAVWGLKIMLAVHTMATLHSMVIFQIVGNVFFKICETNGEGKMDFVGFCE